MSVPIPPDALEPIIAGIAVPLTSFQRIAGWRLSPAGRLSRLMHLHRRAVDAERSGEWTRADFFWGEALRLFRALWQDDAVWSAAANEGRQAIGADLRSVVAQGVADTLWNLHKAHFAATQSSRALAYLHKLRELSTNSGALDNVRRDALVTALRAAVDLCVEEKRWAEAETTAACLVETFGAADEDQTRLAVAMASAVFAGLSAQNEEAAAKRDARSLEKLIARLAQLQNRFPRNAAVFDLIAVACLRHAVKLANSGQLSAALVAIQKAISYDPALAEADQLRQRLTELMRQLQEEAGALTSRLAATPNATLNSKGAAMVAEARRGFEPMHAFQNSPAAQRIIEQFRVAQGWAAWRAIGSIAGEPSDDDLVALHQALVMTFRRAASDAAAVPSAWLEATQAHPPAAAFDSRRIVDWVRDRIDGVSPSAAPAPAEWPALTAIADLAPARRSHEPPLYWLFNREARFTKFVAAAALATLVATGGLFLRESRNRHIRDVAFAALSDARAAGAAGQMLDEADRFLAHPVLGADGRVAVVEEAYGEALVRWFLDHDASETTTERITKYRELVLQRTTGERRQ